MGDIGPLVYMAAEVRLYMVQGSGACVDDNDDNDDDDDDALVLSLLLN